jgi:hypothetical protein
MVQCDPENILDKNYSENMETGISRTPRSVVETENIKKYATF